MKKTELTTENAPTAIGPYAQGTTAGGFVFSSGQLGVDAQTGAFVHGGVAEQTRKAIENVASVLAAGGATLADVVKTTVFLQNMDDFAEMNGVYAEMFGTGAFPARSAVEVARLPKSGLVEVEAIAYIG